MVGMTDRNGPSGDFKKPVTRAVYVFAALLPLSLAACPGSLEDPERFPQESNIGPGSSSGASSSGSGSGGTATCDIPSLLTTTCAAVGSCHLGSPTTGLDLSMNYLALVGVPSIE